jgi:hypothetical protein
MDAMRELNQALLRRNEDKDSCTMRNLPNPTAARVTRSPSKVQRKVMCTNYDGCLDKAIESKWGGFSCGKCCAYQPIQLDASEWLADSLTCMALICVAEFQIDFKQKPRGGIVMKLQRESREPRWVVRIGKVTHSATGGGSSNW